MSRKRPGFKKAHEQVEYDENKAIELFKCFNDPLYFIENYVFIKHPKRGRIKFKMYDYQKEMVKKYLTNRFNITLSARQTGKCFFYSTTVYIIRQPPNFVKRFIKKMLTFFLK